MAKTSWRLAPWYGRSDWLMVDGTIHQGPLVETTPSNRRWRVAGTTMSVQKADLHRAICDHMRTIAARANTRVWLEVSDESDDLGRHGSAAANLYGFDITRAPKLNIDGSTDTYVAFEFTHKSFPLRALLWVIFRQTRGGCHVRTVVTAPVADPGHIESKSVTGHNPNAVTNVTWPRGTEWEQFGHHPRKALAHFLELLRLAQDVDTVSLPDPRGTGTLEFEFTRTNFTTDLYRQALDIVQAEPAMKRLAEHLEGIRRELANLGLVVTEKDRFDQEALLNGRLSELQLRITPQETEDKNNEGIDKYHRVHLDLAHGIFVTSCTRSHLEEAAEQWNIAKFKAEIAGETDVLLAYAQAHAEPGQKARLKKIVRERSFPIPSA